MKIDVCIGIKAKSSVIADCMTICGIFHNGIKIEYADSALLLINCLHKKSAN